MSTYEGRLIRCEKCGLTADRDVVAILNLQMRGLGIPPESPTRGIGLDDGETIGRPKFTFFYKNLPTVNP